MKNDKLIQQINLLDRRMNAVRKVRENATSDWAKLYWGEVSIKLMQKYNDLVKEANV